MCLPTCNKISLWLLPISLILSLCASLLVKTEKLAAFILTFGFNNLTGISGIVDTVALYLAVISAVLVAINFICTMFKLISSHKQFENLRLLGWYNCFLSPLAILEILLCIYFLLVLPIIAGGFGYLTTILNTYISSPSEDEVLINHWSFLLVILLLHTMHIDFFGLLVPALWHHIHHINNNLYNHCHEKMNTYNRYMVHLMHSLLNWYFFALIFASLFPSLLGILNICLYKSNVTYEWIPLMQNVTEIKIWTILASGYLIITYLATSISALCAISSLFRTVGCFFFLGFWV